MNWIYLAIAAQIILGTSAVFDKSLLRRRFFEPVVYSFWFGILGILSLLLLPFGFAAVSLSTLLLSFLAGALFVLSMMFLFMALHKGEASRTLPIIGGLSPVFTLIIGYFLLEGQLGVIDMAGFFFLVLGGFILFIAERREFRLSMIFLTIASAASFGFSNVFTKLVFNETSFITGFVWIKLGSAFFVLFFLLLPSVRRKIFASSRQSAAPHRLLYLANRGYAGLGSILIYAAISLAHPALVDATQGLKYAVIFIAAWLLLKEHFRGKALWGKIAATLFIIIGLLWLGAGNYFRNLPIDTGRTIAWGLTFSSKFSRQMGLDWQKNYEAILNELNPSRVRLVAYWDEIEKERGEFDFSDLDWQIDKSSRNNTEVILAIGMRVPRWPECHIPEWAKNLATEDREAALRDYMGSVVEYYRSHPAIVMWQIENEPYLAFGECPERGKDFLREEIKKVKSLDGTRPALTTDSGEFGLWYKAARQGDVFGATMYRKVYPSFVGRFFGVVEYPITPAHFRLKEKIVRFIISDFDKPFVVIELQGEPWGPVGIPDLSYEEQLAIFDLDYFIGTIEYAKEANFDEYYLWGAEWWYWLKEKQNDAAIWEEAGRLF